MAMKMKYGTTLSYLICFFEMAIKSPLIISILNNGST
uniref:Uncharacterized protein n=1 Tax=Arundo donax TaxID=35708 RepID=A0A0A9CB60_ARUDO